MTLLLGSYLITQVCYKWLFLRLIFLVNYLLHYTNENAQTLRPNKHGSDTKRPQICGYKSMAENGPIIFGMPLYIPLFANVS